MAYSLHYDHLHPITMTAERGQLVISQADNVIYRMTPTDPKTYVDQNDPDVMLRFHDNEPEPTCTLRQPISWFTYHRISRP